MYIAVSLVAAMLLGIGFVLQQHAAEKLPRTYFLHWKQIAELLRKRLWLAGIITMIAGEVLSAWALGHLNLTVSEPLLTTSLIFALLLAVPISGEVLRRTEIIGALLLTAGVTALSVTRSVRATSESFGSFGHWPAAAVIGVLAALVVHYGRKRTAPVRATMTGIGAGLFFGISDALTRRSVQIIDNHGIVALLGTWSGYAVVATTIGALWLMESAFNAGPLHASLPAISAAEPLAGIVLGVIVFGDRIRITPGLLALQAASLAAIVGGVVLVARAPVFRGLHPVTPNKPESDALVDDTSDSELTSRHDSDPAPNLAHNPGAARSADGFADRSAQRSAAGSASTSAGEPAGPEAQGHPDPAVDQPVVTAGDPGVPGTGLPALRGRGRRLWRRLT